MNVLQTIVREKRREVGARKKIIPLEALTKHLKKSVAPPAWALFPRGKINIIGELKRKSPSEKTLLRERNFLKTVRLFEKYCVAISVLTDQKFFGGSLDDLRRVRSATTLPLLQKDFIIDEYQLYEARLYGADLVLLIAAELSLREIKRFLKITRQLGMRAIVEVHTKEELTKALRANAHVIGINSRNLKTFSVDLSTVIRLARYVPKNIVVIAESGIHDRRDIDFLENDVRGFLVGTSILRSSHPEKKLKEFLGA